MPQYLQTLAPPAQPVALPSTPINPVGLQQNPYAAANMASPFDDLTRKKPGGSSKIAELLSNSFNRKVAGEPLSLSPPASQDGVMGLFGLSGLFGANNG
jgi:hypothetical protein